MKNITLLFLFIFPFILPSQVYVNDSDDLEDLVNAASTEVNIIDPNLNFDGTTWRATSTSPLLAHNISNWAVDQDIDGQARPLTSTVGADHFSTDLVQYLPMTPDDVGPNAYEPNEVLTPCLFSVGAENLLEKSAIKIYPNPTTSQLIIENHNAIANTFTKISLWSIDGRLLLEEKLMDQILH